MKGVYRQYISLGFLLLSVLACSLSGPSAPTLVPRLPATHVPLVFPTIGYVTAVPRDVPSGLVTPQTLLPSTDTNILTRSDQVSIDQLMLHVRTLQGFTTRHVNSIQTRDDIGIGAAKRYILRQFETIQNESQGNLYVFPHEFPVTWVDLTTLQTNVVAIINGREANAGVILVGAHYDSRGDDINDPIYAPGANDNGTGVAALIEIARMLAKSSHRATLMFVAFSAEEVNRKGSIAFVNDYVLHYDLDVRAFVNIDTIGSQTYTDGRVNDRNLRVFSKGPDSASISRQIARLANLIAFNYVPNMEVSVQNAIDREGRYGDHFSFEERGFPSIRFIETAENDNYRDSTDTLEGINREYFHRSTQTILTIVGVMADGPLPPQNIILREARETNARTLVWEPVPDATSYLVALRPPNARIYQQFETEATSVTWDGFTATNFEAIAIAAKDQQGVIGMLSDEIDVP